MQRFIQIFAIGVIAALSLSACTKSTSESTSTSTTTTETQAPAAGASTAAMSTTAAAAAGGAGMKVYNTSCASCHQANGQGLAGTFPPLAGNPVVTGDPKNLIHIVKYGLSTKITVNGKSYNGMMPPWGSQLSNDDLASAVTYIRTSWGNSAAPVTAADVAAVAK